MSPFLFIIPLFLRSIKQGYSFPKGETNLNHLLFMNDLKLYGSNQNEIDSVVKTVEIVTKDIAIKFHRDKCGVLTMKKEREIECDGIELKHGEENGQVGKARYKYLGIMD